MREFVLVSNALYILTQCPSIFPSHLACIPFYSIHSQKFLLYGKTGWIGGKLIKLLEEQGINFALGSVRLENRESLIKEIKDVKPTHILCAAGVTGRPNVDWCDLNQEATIRANVIGALNIADICSSEGIHLTLYATGCIFEYDADHKIGGTKFGDDDNGNFDGSFYSKTKAMVEQMLRSYKNIMILRVRMPISDDLVARNFITKIAGFNKVVDIPNSMTILHELLPASIEMAKKGLTGVYNFCNPGAISHNEILDLYIKFIDPSFSYENFTVEEQDKILIARRSNNELDCTKLVEAVPECKINEIHVGMEEVFKRMKVNLQNEGNYPPPNPKRKK